MVHGLRLDKSLTRDFPRLGALAHRRSRSLATRLAPEIKTTLRARNWRCRSAGDMGAYLLD
jgi:hypothetical protein